MIYLDYSATTPVNEKVLESFNNACNNYVGNANSLHKLGSNASNLIDMASKQISNILNLKDKEIIYTSGSSESNNLAIKGIAFKYSNRGKHIITTKYEHSSTIEAIKYLESIGYEVSYIDSDINGVVSLDSLKKIIRDDTILVSVNAINSEIGIIEPIDEIGLFLNNYSKCFFHVDLTQALGKININFDNIDLASISAHKIYGIKGIGALIKRNNIMLEPLIHGGESTTIYRSGTPAHPLIASLSRAIRLSYENIDSNYEYVSNLNKYLISKLSGYTNVYINSNDKCIPHILNVSIKGVKSETFMRALSEYDIYISTKTACSSNDSYSESVYELTKDMDRAKESIRISLSYLTTYQEIDEFLKYFDICYKKLVA